jgi:hypothetical protein
MMSFTSLASEAARRSGTLHQFLIAKIQPLITGAAV